MSSAGPGVPAPCPWPVYGKLCTEFYDLDKPVPPPDAFDFYEHYARAAAGPILEPMCGSGRFLLPLLEQGLDVEGTDASPSMLAACRERAGERGLSPVLHEQALERLELTRRFGLIFICSGSFGLLIEQSAVCKSLQKVFEALLPGGMFLVEVERQVESEPAFSGTWGGRWVERADGAKLILSWLSQYSGSANVAQSVLRYELVQAGRLLEVEYQDFRVRSYAPGELLGLLEGVGFVDISELEPFQHTPAGPDETASVFRCRKP